MDVLRLRRTRRLHRLVFVAPSCAGFVGLAACNALVGVDFGEAHLALDAGADAGMVSTMDSALDSKGAKDAGADRHDARETTDAAHPGDGTVRDATGDAHARLDAGADAERDAADAGIDSPSCDRDASPTTEACLVSNQFGVFVAPPSAGGSDTAGAGTKASPYATIGAGIAHAGGKRVYVCSATYPEQIELTSTTGAVNVYGGFACPGDAGPAWSFTGQAATVAPVVPGYALDIENVTAGAHFTSMAFVSTPAASPAAPSSIAVMVNASTGISFANSSFTAGLASPGAPGAVPAINTCMGSNNGVANSGAAPGIGPTCTCAVAGTGSSTGGNGKPSHATTTTAAEIGSANPAPTPADGEGQPGTGTAGVGDCTVGHVGQPGNAGTAGAAGAPGTLTAMGWSTAVATSGTAGTPGQGGGGGGGEINGGASGGAGGCGGTGGPGGGGGGASIAVVMWMSSVTFSAVLLESSTGGQGGAGQAGGAAQAGGTGGVPSPNSPLDSCAGGGGAPGGGGGGGGGGAGGPSLGIAYNGTAPVIDGQVTTTGPLATPSSYTGPTNAAAGGAGGAGGAATGGINGAAGANGAMGIMAPIASF